MKSLFINISDQGNFPGIKIFETKLLVEGSAITLPGIGIFLHSGIKGSKRLRVLQHEYGHFLDYLSISEFKFFAMIKFYIFIGLPSFISAATGIGGNHRTYRTEIRANRLAEKWFGNNLSKDFKKVYPVK